MQLAGDRGGLGVERTDCWLDTWVDVRRSNREYSHSCFQPPRPAGPERQFADETQEQRKTPSASNATGCTWNPALRRR